MTNRQCHHIGRDGDCMCPKCETRITHRPGVPCREERCPHCGNKMLRVGSEHHRMWLAKRDKASKADQDGG